MVQPGWDSYLDRLGPTGLRLILASLPDAKELAAVVGQETDAGAPLTDLDPLSRADIVADLCLEDSSLPPRLLDLLDREAGERLRRTWDEKEVRRHIAEMIREPSADAAQILHCIARASRPGLAVAEIRAAAEIVAGQVLDLESGSVPKRTAKVASDRASLRALEQERRELEIQVRRLEGQLHRTLERSAKQEEILAKRAAETMDLQRSAKSARDQLQQLERELISQRKRTEALLEKRAKERTGEITTALRKLTREQRRTSSALEKVRALERERRDVLKEQAKGLLRLGDLIEKVVFHNEAQSRLEAAAQSAILKELSDIRASVERSDDKNRKASPASPTKNRSRTETRRVGVFVDVQNMFYGAREKGARLDFEALLETTCKDRQLVRAVAYLVESRDIDQSAFIHLLQMKAYEVKRKPLRVRHDKSAKGNWDLEMALDALSAAADLDIVVLVTGDGDFVPLVHQLKRQGLRVEVYGFRRSTAPDLAQACDRFIPITRKLLRKPTERKTARKTPTTRDARA